MQPGQQGGGENDMNDWRFNVIYLKSTTN